MGAFVLNGAIACHRLIVVTLRVQHHSTSGGGAGFRRFGSDRERSLGEQQLYYSGEDPPAVQRAGHGSWSLLLVDHRCGRGPDDVVVLDVVQVVYGFDRAP
jgi:hypothetical protein